MDGKGVSAHSDYLRRIMRMGAGRSLYGFIFAIFQILLARPDRDEKLARRGFAGAER